MIRIQAFSLFARRYSLHQKGQPNVSRVAFNSSTTTRDGQHGVKSIDELPGPGKFENIATFIRKGGLKNLYEIQCGKFEKFGPIFKEEMFGKQMVHIADAEAQAFIARTEGTFQIRGFIDIDVMVDTAIYSLGGDDYERWKAARSPVARSFLRPIEIQKFAPGIDSVAKDAVRRLRRMLKGGRIVALKREHLDGYTTENILLLVYGVRMGFYDDPQNPKVIEFTQAAIDFNDALMPLGVGLPLWRYVTTPTYRKFVRAKETLYDIASTFSDMRDTKQQQQGEDQLSLFDKVPSDEGQADMAVGLSQGGVETTSNALLWLMYHLSKYPEAQEKAYQEIVSVIGTAANDKSPEDPQFHSRLPYVKGCMKESMRLNPIVLLLPRIVEQDITVCGYTIPANTHVAMWFSYASSLEKNFSKPEEFNPQRWIRDEPKEEIHKAHASIPFGVGVRKCLGRRFAELEMVIGIAKILQSFRLEYVGNDSIKGTFRGAMSIPEKELPIKFIERA